VELPFYGYACYELRDVVDGTATYVKVGNLRERDEALRWQEGGDVPLMHWTVEEVK
jgi:hypothetical protein